MQLQMRMDGYYTILVALQIFMFFYVNDSLAFAKSLGSGSADLAALLEFKNVSDSAGHELLSWNRSDPIAMCDGSWLGVTCSSGRATRLVLQGLNLSGSTGFIILTRLDQLRVLSLKSNRLTGPIPDLSNLSALKLLFLSHNQFTGSIPISISSLNRLYRLDLGFNNLTGPVPVELNRLQHLLTLRLESNRLSGPVSGLVLPHLQDLNLSSNLLSGAVPPAFAGFPATSFAGNRALCGGPLPACANVVSDPSRPAPNATRPVTPADALVASSPTTKPEVAPAGGGAAAPAKNSGRSGKMSRVAVVAIVAGDFAVLALVSGLLFCYFWRKFAGKNPSQLHEGEKIVYSSSPYPTAGAGASSSGDAAGTGGAFERGKMVFFDGSKRFELEELLRASAEMLGKGAYGTAYRAVLDDGNVVAVKRLRDVSNFTGKREFESHMESLGRLRHQNVVPLKAYYYARDEKLLVYEFMPNGSLFAILHGNRGPGRTALDWRTRLRFALGAAKGLAYIHQSSRSPKLSHGNLKSTNILVDSDGNARLADCGLATLGPATASVGKAGGYRAPEAPADGRKPWATQRADVYAFGVVLLELLTGKPAVDGGGGAVVTVDLPRWVQSVVREEWTAEVFDIELMRYKGIEEEMVAVLQIAMSCTAVAPDQRPKIGNVVKMIDEIVGGGGGRELSPSHESIESVSESPSVSDDATTGQSSESH